MAHNSAKQIAMAWVNRCLEPERINAEDHELIALSGDAGVKSEVIAEARQMIMDDLAKLKPRYADYCAKYVKVKPLEDMDASSQSTETND